MIYDLPVLSRGRRATRPAPGRLAFMVGFLFLARSLVDAFPPAPHHVIHGTVRDEYGAPLSLSNAEVFLETTNGVRVTCSVAPEIQTGENYRLIVPMDSLSALDPYKATALPPTVRFRIKVRIGPTVYVPIEMAGNLSTLGQPAAETMVNLTLGTDSDGDGLPDAWENLLSQMLGGGLGLADITPNGDNDHDGISNSAEYLAGTYAWDSTDAPGRGLKLGIVRRGGQGPVLQFFGVAGRSYSVFGTTNLTSWSAVSVRVPPGDINAPVVSQYANPSSQIVEVEVVLPPTQPTAMFFRVLSQ